MLDWIVFIFVQFYAFLLRSNCTMVEKESKKKTDVVNKSNKKLKKCHVFVPNGQEYLCEIPVSFSPDILNILFLNIKLKKLL